jgi:CHAT domain-containing protein
LTAILEKPRQPPRQFQGLVVVTQPNTPGSASLPGTEKELIHIQSHTKNLRVENLPGEKATVESVLSSMKTCNWVHLACHAVQILAEPTKSGFLLHNGALELSEIIKLSLPHADFTFLSACQTATGNEKLSEEAVHLAAGMLSAGYRSVIATMWSISDKEAPLLADDIYSDLLKEGEPDSTRAAYALHRAVKNLRQRSGESSFLSWVPFIHFGI